jgi:hypothetical protein
MNFTQMHERLRTELLRRIHRGSLTVSHLAKQTGFGRSHVSNFLHARGHLSLQALDRILAAQHLTAEDLIRFSAQYQHRTHSTARAAAPSAVPLVSHATALYEPFIRAGAVQTMLQLPPGALSSAHPRVVASRRAWQRFVAVRIDRSSADAMQPLLYEGAIAVIDRHYNSVRPHASDRPNVYAVRDESHLVLRYAEYISARLVLRPLNIQSALTLIEVDPDVSPGEYIAGRVALILNEV